MPAVSVQSLTMSYGSSVVVEDVSFDVEYGDYVCIVGTNGAGKSTLLKGLAGIQPYKKGTIVLDDNLRRTQIGYLPQQTAVQKDFPASVWEVVLSGCASGLGLRPFYTKKDKAFAAENMQRLGITDLKNKSYQNLSGGQQQRVLLAKALCGAEKLLFLDEPVSGLDPVVTSELYTLIRRLNQEKNLTVIMVSHDISNAVTAADKILHLDRQLLFYGSTAEYLTSSVGKRFLSEEQ